MLQVRTNKKAWAFEQPTGSFEYYKHMWLKHKTVRCSTGVDALPIRSFKKDSYVKFDAIDLTVTTIRQLNIPEAISGKRG